VGELDPSGVHRAESISGRVDLTPLSGVTAELRAVSGSIVSHVEHRGEGGRGYWRSIVGDGRASFRVNSTSGSLHILAAQPEDRVVAETAPAATTKPAQPAPTAAPQSAAQPSAAPSGAAPFGTQTPAPDRPASAAAPVAEPEPQETEETWNPDDTADVPADPLGDDELAVLQALERGEIGVDEAAERLERARG
jgi:hypothetical protein